MGLLPEPADRKHPLRFLKRFADAGRLPLAERILRWNGYFPVAGRGCCARRAWSGRAAERVVASYEAELGGAASPLARLLQLNWKTYLLDDLLVKMDRCSMAHGLEARSPFLDTAVVEFGAALPNRLRMRWGKGKLLLRRAMKDILPASILARGKMGFGAPLGVWFRGDLQPLVHERLLPATSPIYEYLRPEPVAELVVGPHGPRRRPVTADLVAAHPRELAAAVERQRRGQVWNCELFTIQDLTPLFLSPAPCLPPQRAHAVGGRLLSTACFTGVKVFR